MLFASTSNIGCVRKENQDALGHIEVEYGHLFVVCDGISGLSNGALSSQTAVDSIISSFSISIEKTPELQLQKAMENGHKSVIEANPEPLGTTAVSCYINNKTAYTSWCGDSRIYHLRNKKIIWLSRDHNVLHDILNRGKGKGDVFQNPQAITRFLGRKEYHKPDFHEFYVDSNDIILICSDGLHGFIMEPDIIQMTTEFSPQKASNMLEKKLLSKEIGAPDNFTWYIIQI